MVRPIEEEAMTALSDAMRILKEVGEQVNGQLFADHVSCLRCMIWGEAARQCAEANDAQCAEL